MRKALLGVAALTVAIPALPSTAAAQSYNDHGRYERDYRDGNYRDGGYRNDDRRDRTRYSRYYDRNGYYNGPTWRGSNGRYQCRRSDGTTGLLIGGVAGALVGRSIDTHGDRTTGTLLGAVAGALLGKSVDKDNRGGRRCR